MPRPLSIAFVHAFGEAREQYFADTLLALMAADAVTAGHRAASVRVYYDGRDPERDREVARRLAAWLADEAADVVVVERVFDPEPIASHAAAPGRVALQVTRGDSLEPTPGIEWVLGVAERSPRTTALREAFVLFLEAWAEGRALADVPGLARVENGALRSGLPLPESAPVRPFEPVTEFDVIALVEPPPVRAKTLLGNEGCPYAADALDNPHYAGIELPPGAARLGCAFCHMGGDYEKRPDAEVVRELVEQALHSTTRLPHLEELVLSDQHALRYLAELVERAYAAGVRPMRWLFPARPDSFVRERDKIARAAEVAARLGHVVELHLAGFEALSDRELARYNKGTTKAEIVAAVRAMRELERAHPAGFAFMRAKAHSLLLWSPWTTLADLRESVEALGEHDLDELFNDIGRNRLRLYRELPIYWAAERDGAVGGASEGSGRRKGYSTELPWRFLDPQAGVAHALSRSLRDALGGETELAQLAAAVDFAERGLDASGVMPALARLDAAVARYLAPTFVGRGASERGAGVRFLAEPHDEARRVARARRDGLPLLLAGREPTAHPDFLALVRLARGDDARRVGVVTDARRFSDAGFVTAAKSAGLTAASLRLDAGDPESLRGARELRRALSAVELRVSPLDERAVELAKELGVRQLRIEAALDAIGLHALDDATSALERLAARTAGAGLGFEVAPLRAGSADYRWLPR